MTRAPGDEEIVRSTTLRPIADVAQSLGLSESEWAPYGRVVAKIETDRLLERTGRDPKGRLILVSAITPTPAGEGKTTTSIGLAQALQARGKNVSVALREPSLGPCMGVKGGGTGGGRSQVAPPDLINLHFTGDLHAITAANNLLAALIDNSLYQGNPLQLDARRIAWRRVMDMNDRSLRNTLIGLGGPTQGAPRETGFDITAASEVMAALCLAEDAEDLRARLNRIVVGYTFNKEPIRAEALEAAGPMLALLREALNPNLVQTLEGVPAFLHGGPFANIAHGCNSVRATRTALACSDWVVTEAGFGFDLGAEKFLDIKCRQTGLWPSAIVLVATIRALKMHGGVKKKELGKPDTEALLRGMGNLERHVESARGFGIEPVIAINEFAQDSEEELAALFARCADLDVKVARSRHHADGGAGALDLADLVVEVASKADAKPRFTYELSDSIEQKIEGIAKSVYGASGVLFTAEAKSDMKRLLAEGCAEFPVCMAKTQSSVSDNPKLVGRPTGFDITVRSLRANHSAGFLVALTGDIVRMPGLPPAPMSRFIDLVDGEIVGIQ